MILSVNMNLLPPPLVKPRFIFIQELALSKGFRWYYSGKVTSKNLNTILYTTRHFSVDFDNKQMLFERGYPQISYREMYYKLKAL